MIKENQTTARTTLIFLVYIILSCFSFSQQAHAWGEKVTLQESSVIKDPFIRLKHVFSGVKSSKEHALAPAPTDSKPYTLSHSDLKKIANAFDLNWIDETDNAFLTLHSGLEKITTSQLENLLKDSVLSDEIGDKFSLIISEDTNQFLVPKDASNTYKITDISYNRLSENFSASLKVIDQNNDIIDSKKIHGVARKIVNLPVLSKRLKHGDIIKASHIEFIETPKKSVQSDIILDPNELIGMTARKSISSETAIKDSDIMPPLLVQKNEIVTVSMNAGLITITTKARALDVGAKGDIIQVMNTDSRKIFEGVVTGPQTVSINNG